MCFVFVPVGIGLEGFVGARPHGGHELSRTMSKALSTSPLNSQEAGKLAEPCRGLQRGIPPKLPFKERMAPSAQPTLFVRCNIQPRLFIRDLHRRRRGNVQAISTINHCTAKIREPHHSSILSNTIYHTIRYGNPISCHPQGSDSSYHPFEQDSKHRSTPNHCPSTNRYHLFHSRRILFWEAWIKTTSGSIRF